MSKPDQEILDLMISIGFKLVHTVHTGIGTVNRYKYYPNYFHEKHYTLVLFKPNNDYTEHRLYIHRDSDESYLDSIYKIDNMSNWTSNKLIEKIKEIFESEMRIITIQEIIS